MVPALEQLERRQAMDSMQSLMCSALLLVSVIAGWQDYLSFWREGKQTCHCHATSYMTSTCGNPLLFMSTTSPVPADRVGDCANGPGTRPEAIQCAMQAPTVLAGKPGAASCSTCRSGRARGMAVVWTLALRTACVAVSMAFQPCSSRHCLCLIVPSSPVEQQGSPSLPKRYPCTLDSLCQCPKEHLLCLFVRLFRGGRASCLCLVQSHKGQGPKLAATSSFNLCSLGLQHLMKSPADLRAIPTYVSPSRLSDIIVSLS